MPAKPLISVIVPVYKVEAFLPLCVESLLAQSFVDFELILVNDGSPDNCGTLCDKYAHQDNRVKVIHQKNGGLSAARNSGIQAAQGDYYAFVDSDDTVHPDFLKCMYDACIENQADMCVCAVEDVAEDGSSFTPPAMSIPNQEGVFSGKELVPYFFSPGGSVYTVAWNKLYKAQLWQQLRYPVGMIHEDDAVAHQLYWGCPRVACISQPLYRYRLRQGSICRTTLTPASFDSVSVLAQRCCFLETHSADSELLSQAVAACWRRYLWICSQACSVQLTWPLAARWHLTQTQMARLLALAKSCTHLCAKEKLSCIRWAKKQLPLPAKNEKKRVALLLPPGLPVPAVKGGAVESLVSHLVTQNQQNKQLELVVVCQWDEQAAGLAERFSETLFYYQTPPQMPALSHSLRVRAAALTGNPIHWNAWYAKPLPFLKQLNADLYVAQGGDLTGWQQASRTLGRGRFAAHLHGVTPGSPLLDSLYSRAFSISDYVSRIWQAGSAGLADSVMLLPNCVDTSIFKPTQAFAAESTQLRTQLGFAPDDFIVIFCGRTCPEKGIHKLVEAFGLMNDATVKLLVVGSPFFAAQSQSPFLSELQQKAERLNGRIHFTGFVQNTALPAYYRMADLACFPALWDEPAGITAIEAMACGCPIVATLSGGMPEYLNASKAILLPRSQRLEGEQLHVCAGVPELADALAAAIESLKQDAPRRDAMKNAGLQASARYTAEQYYQNFCQLVSKENLP